MSIWGDTTIKAHGERIAQLERHVTELSLRYDALLAQLEQWRTILEAESRAARAEVSPPRKQARG